MEHTLTVAGLLKRLGGSSWVIRTLYYPVKRSENLWVPLEPEHYHHFDENVVEDWYILQGELCIFLEGE